MARINFLQPTDTYDKIKRTNNLPLSQNLLVSCINAQNHLAPFSPIFIKPSPSFNCLNYLNRILPDTKYILSTLQKNKIHPSIIISLYNLLKTIVNHTQTHIIDNGLAGAQILENAAHLRHHQLHSLHELVDKIFHVLKHMAESTSHEISSAYHELYQSLRQELKNKFNHDFNRFLSKAEHFFHDDIWQSIRLHSQLGWHISHEIALNELSHAANYVKQIADGLFVLDITGTLIEAGEIVIHNKNWFKNLSRLTLDVEAFFISSAVIDTTLVTLSLTPAGWVGCIFVGAATLYSQHELMKHALTPYLNYIDNRYS